MINPFIKIIKGVRGRFPAATFRPDLAAHPQGASFLEIELNDHRVIIEWRRARGYGVTASSHEEYGEGPHEVFADPQTAAERVKILLLSRTKTNAPQPLLLQSLRKSRRVSQVQLAKRLGIHQAAISKLEKRRDWRLSTLQSVVAALQGRLNIRVAFPDGATREIQLATKKS